MDQHARSFLDALVTTPGVSGSEERVQQVVRDFVADFADEVTTDLHGNVVAAVQPDAALRVMWAGHCDQLGLLVSHMDENGYLYVQPVGGWDPQQLVGQQVTVWAAAGPVEGVIARKAIHLLEEEERKKVVAIKDLWIDIGAADKAEAGGLVEVGDSVTVRMGLRELRNRRVAGPALDNRTGVWVVMEGLRRAAQRDPSCGIFAVSTVQEEIGLRGAATAAFGVDPHVGIAVDVTHATDCPTVDKRQRGDVTLGDGPVLIRGPNVNPRVGARLRAVAESHDIPVQAAALSRAASNDANPLQLTRAGVAAGLVQIPNRYMHSPVEMVSLDDLDHAAELLAAFTVEAGTVGDYVP